MDLLTRELDLRDSEVLDSWVKLKFHHDRRDDNQLLALMDQKGAHFFEKVVKIFQLIETRLDGDRLNKIASWRHLIQL